MCPSHDRDNTDMRLAGESLEGRKMCISVLACADCKASVEQKMSASIQGLEALA